MNEEPSDSITALAFYVIAILSALAAIGCMINGNMFPTTGFSALFGSLCIWWMGDMVNFAKKIYHRLGGGIRPPAASAAAAVEKAAQSGATSAKKEARPATYKLD